MPSRIIIYLFNLFFCSGIKYFLLCLFLWLHGTYYYYKWRHKIFILQFIVSYSGIYVISIFVFLYSIQTLSPILLLVLKSKELLCLEISQKFSHLLQHQPLLSIIWPGNPGSLHSCPWSHDLFIHLFLNDVLLGPFESRVTAFTLIVSVPHMGKAFKK